MNARQAMGNGNTSMLDITKQNNQLQHLDTNEPNHIIIRGRGIRLSGHVSSNKRDYFTKGVNKIKKWGKATSTYK